MADEVNNMRLDLSNFAGEGTGRWSLEDEGLYDVASVCFQAFKGLDDFVSIDLGQGLGP